MEIHWRIAILLVLTKHVFSQDELMCQSHTNTYTISKTDNGSFYQTDFDILWKAFRRGGCRNYTTLLPSSMHDEIDTFEFIKGTTLFEGMMLAPIMIMLGLLIRKLKEKRQSVQPCEI